MDFVGTWICKPELKNWLVDFDNSPAARVDLLARVSVGSWQSFGALEN